MPNLQILIDTERLEATAKLPYTQRPDDGQMVSHTACDKRDHAIAKATCEYTLKLMRLSARELDLELHEIASDNQSWRDKQC